ncbi:DUF421 domain-containing protein [Ramlibacter tataouinensis]|uniref:YetF C-terminal domain-containing protein n=1 Tax=Ramlibacter tataouinensis (strain ATCC BAA-407 / DSM 14655 / LMG 21543 / TTB310) TaxID=365046 RepID=F5Y334_RAMTT|nr:YetF domain-containing protein [Ramlibacter tataouinensis]AEG94914.1 conserved hypothetical protein [Ramlibacter tataouinensis TTB310]
MLDLQLPWWEFVVRAAAVYAALMVMVRLTGKRTVGQFTPFDLLVVMLLSEAVSDALSGGDESLLGGLIVAATLVVLNMVMAVVTSRSDKADRLLQGAPVLVGRDGVIYEDVLKRQRVPVADVEKALRSADCDVQDMRMAILEADGSINVMKKPG